MISGNREIATMDVTAIALESLMSVIAMNIDWNSGNRPKEMATMSDWARQVANVVISNMSDSGDCPYVKGKPSQVDIDNGVKALESILIVYFNTTYASKKASAFKTAFKANLSVRVQKWKEVCDVHFGVSASRQAAGRKC